MAWAFVQDDQDSDAGSLITFPIVQGVNPTAGNLICGWIGWGNPGGETLNSITDTRGNAYTLGSQVNDVTNAQAYRHFHAKNIIGGGANTITATFSVAVNFRFGQAAEYSGLDTSAPFDVQAVQFQAAPGTGADAVSSTALTTTVTNELVFGGTENSAEDLPGTGTIVAGTGFTSRELLNTSTGRLEDLNKAAAGSQAATFTQSVNNARLTGAMAFKEPQTTVVDSIIHRAVYRGVELR